VRLRERVARVASSSPRLLARALSRALLARARVSVALERRGLDELLRDLDEAASPSLHPWDRTVLEVALAVSDALWARAPRSRDTCLYRALGRYAVLRHAGLAPVLFVAVRGGIDDRDEELGHAWVELDGRPFPPEALPPLVVSYRHPAAPPLDRFASGALA
jgi:hypothetical protein